VSLEMGDITGQKDKRLRYKYNRLFIRGVLPKPRAACVH
jgi:hypothetical protein